MEGGKRLMDMGKELRIIEFEEFEDSDIFDLPLPEAVPQPADAPSETSN
jgi:hypothetical protein